ncbi:MAG: hypothetical protein IIZ39_04665 [Blautia sp.]|nr:hypothetical protein [Blautia sp.]
MINAEDKNLEKEVLKDVLNQLKEDYAPGKMAEWMGCSPSAVSKMGSYTETRVPTTLEILGFCQGSGMSLLKVMHMAHSILQSRADDLEYAALADVIDKNIRLVEDSEISVFFSKLSVSHKKMIMNNIKLLAEEDSQKRKVDDPKRK